eukprot:TRINITY_DN36484_c0_g1_i1.p1 TRINITY_DN36484_c0_g1~~TRINITY_DN36484_c0_g1_i1.p1  ORF type:complete len:411 (-),score=-6.93 TRINITY_DN36484_c0_g1_i1:33-1265(-)
MAGNGPGTPPKGPPRPRPLAGGATGNNYRSIEDLSAKIQQFLDWEESANSDTHSIDIQVATVPEPTRETRPVLDNGDSTVPGKNDHSSRPLSPQRKVPTLSSPPKHRHILLRERRHTVDNVEGMFTQTGRVIDVNAGRSQPGPSDVTLRAPTHPGQKLVSDDPLLPPSDLPAPSKSAGPSPATARTSWRDRRGTLLERPSRSLTSAQAPLATRAARWSNFPDSSANIRRLSSNAEKDRAQFQAGHILPPNMYADGTIGSNSWGSSPRTTRRMPSLAGSAAGRNSYKGLRAPPLWEGGHLSAGSNTPVPVSRKRSNVCISNPGLPQPLYIFSSHPHQPRTCGFREPLWRVTHEPFWESDSDADDPFQIKYGPYQARDLSSYIRPLAHMAHGRLPRPHGLSPLHPQQHLQYR